jgi:polyphenol oxidase
MTGEVVHYASPLLEELGVAHAFSTRIGGISTPPFDSLNLGNPSGCEVQDDYETIYENYRILQRVIGHERTPRVWVHQVHGGAVATVRRGEMFESGAKADALVSDDPQRLMAVRVADCVPILMASKDGPVVAAVHAGWRGVIAGVVPRAIARMTELDADARPGGIMAAIGPCIGFEQFEVGGEVLAEFRRVFGADAPIKPTADGKGHVDLRRAVEMQLLMSGIPADQIDTTDRCTFRDGEEFYSHRRDRGVTGRMAALIAAGGTR